MPSRMQLPWDKKFVIAAHLELFSPPEIITPSSLMAFLHMDPLPSPFLVT